MHDAMSKPVAEEVLAFSEVTAASSGVHGGPVRDATFRLQRGGVVLVHVEEGHEEIPLADLASGLLTPDQGKVVFLDEDWASMGARRQSELRGRIRRVFRHYGWVSNLDVIENICLSEGHHTGRKFADIASEAQLLARRFGMDGIPVGRPTRVHPMILRKLEWVRAFMGTPELIILERPLAGAPRGDMARLVDAAGEARQEGSAVLWITDEDRDWDCGQLGASSRFQIKGEVFCPA